MQGAPEFLVEGGCKDLKQGVGTEQRAVLKVRSGWLGHQQGGGEDVRWGHTGASSRPLPWAPCRTASVLSRHFWNSSTYSSGKREGEEAMNWPSLMYVLPSFSNSLWCWVEWVGARGMNQHGNRCSGILDEVGAVL